MHCLVLQATLKAIQKQTGLKDLSLRDVPMDSFQVYIGSQHHLALEIDGQQFEVTLNNRPTDEEQAAAAAAGQGGSLPQQQALPMPEVGDAWVNHRGVGCQLDGLGGLLLLEAWQPDIS